MRRVAALLLALTFALPAQAQLPLPGASLIVSMNSPASDATVSGTVTVSASVTIVGALTVARVDFYADGGFIGSDTSAPYAVGWDSRTVANGSHSLKAVAQDILGLRWSANPITVNVSNGPPPDTTPPNVGITSPANGATVSGTITVTASASDNIGVAGVQFQLDGANGGAPDTSAPYSIAWNTATVSDGTHTITAIAADAAGNQAQSAAVSVTVANAGGTPSAARFEEDNPAIVTAGAWARVGSEVAAFSGGTAGTSNTSGASASLTFRGSAVTWIGLKCNACGIATVSIDGGAPQAVDTAGPGAPDGSLASAAVFSASGLDPAASHTLTIDVTGDTTSGNAYVMIDAFDVEGGTGSAVTRIEETEPGTSFAGAWALRGAETATFSGGAAGSADAAGAASTLDFTGTGVSWIGLRCSACGIATVALDGGAPDTVDTAGAAAPGSPGLASEPVYSASGLVRGSHRLVITVTGTTNTGAAHVIVDAFDVTP